VIFCSHPSTSPSGDPADDYRTPSPLSEGTSLPRAPLQARCPLLSSAGFGDPPCRWHSTMAQTGMAHGQGCQGGAKAAWAQDGDPGGTLPLTVACCFPGRMLTPCGTSPGQGTHGCHRCRGSSEGTSALPAPAACLCWTPSRKAMAGCACTAGGVRSRNPPGTNFWNRNSEKKGACAPPWHPTNTQHAQNAESRQEAVGVITA